MFYKVLGAASAGLALLMTGCATTTPDPTSNTVQAIYGTVRSLDKELGQELDQLRTTTADLSARVGENDRQSKRIASLLEENQVRLEQMQDRVNDLVRVVYREAGLTPPRDTRSSGVSDVSVGGGPRYGESSPPGMDRDDGLDEGGADPEMHPFGLEGDAPAGGDAAGEEAPSDDVDLARSPITEYKEAQDAYMAGDYEKAVELYSAYIRRYPNSDYASNALLWLGQSHYKIRQYEDAIEAYEQLRREHPESHRVPIAYFNEAAAHAELDNAGRAVELLEELVENYPASQPAREAKEKLRSVRR